jgi:DNA-binding transcriptional LysR family regulator
MAGSLDDIALFAAVVEEESFTRAAARLDVSKSTLSRRVRDLEEELGVRLLQRTTRHVRPTDAGAEFYAAARAGLRAIEDARARLADQRAEPGGVLRISTVPSLDELRFDELLDAYLTAYPAVSIEVVGEHRNIDLVRDGYDAALRAGPLPDSSMVAVRLGEFTGVLYASREYVERHGAPTTPADLSNHSVIGFGIPIIGTQKWRLVDEESGEAVEVPVSGRITINEVGAARRLMLRGYGISLVDRRVRFSERAVRVLPRWHTPKVPFHLVYPGGGLVPPRTRAFIEVAKKHFANWVPRV